MYDFFKNISNAGPKFFPLNTVACDNGAQNTLVNKNQPQSSVYSEWLRNGAIGGGVGYAVGCVVSLPEKLKVKRGISPMEAFSLKNSFRSLFDIKLTNIHGFGVAFAGTCAIELSVIEGSKSLLAQQGNYSPIQIDLIGSGAAALSASMWLTPADHILLRAEKFKESSFQSLQKLYTMGRHAVFAGYAPMVAREFVFALAHLCWAKNVGRFFYNLQHPETPISQEELPPSKYRMLGSMALGPLAAAITQPKDRLKTELQLQIAHDQKPNWKQAVKDIHARGMKEGFKKSGGSKIEYLRAGFMKGLGPRAVLATFGGATVGTVYQAVDKHLKETSSLKL